MGTDDRWYFTKEQLENSPSRQCGIDSHKELTYRQQAANFIRDMGHNLKVSQLCVNTAIVYMHRFYVFHSFTHFPWHSIAAAALFLAAKVEEQPRKVEYVVKVAFMCKNHKELNCDANHQDKYQQLSQDLVFNENVLLQTLGFDVAIDHPHTHIVRCCHLVKAGKDLAHTSYFMASNSLHLTTMCLQYKPTVVACFCIHLACKWSQWEIPLSNEKKEWFSYVDATVTAELLQQLTEEFLVVFDQCPSRLREKALAVCGNRPAQQQQQQQPQSGTSSSQQQQLDSGGELKKVDHNPSKGGHAHRQSHHGEGKAGVFDDPHKHRRPHEHGSSSGMQQQQLQQRDRDREYREKKERERLAAQQHGAKMPGMPGQHPSNKQPVPHHNYHHRSSSDSSKHPRPPMPAPSSRQEPRDILREATKDIGLRDYRDPKREPTKESMSRDLNREHQQMRSSSSSSNTSNNASSSDKVMNNYPLNYDKQRMHVDPNKVPPKHEQVRRHDDIYLKNENEIKKHLSASVRDKNASSSGYISRSVPPQQQQQQLSLQQQQQQQKLKSPFITDPSKSVLKPNVNPIKQESSSYSASNYHPPVTEIKPEVLPQLPVKKPSLFSPEKSPPSKKFIPKKIESVNSTSSSGISSMTSPIDTAQRFRTTSSGSEPELRPVIQKIEQQQGFEMLLKDPSAGIKLEQVADVAAVKEDKPESSYSKDTKPPDVILPFNSATPLVNGIETNPTLISNLLKEAPSVPHLPAVAATTPQPTEAKEKTHGHKEHKKKNKEKHKHKDKNKEEKEKKKKHKDKDREKHKHRDKHHEEEIQPQPMVAEPIKLTIQKDRIQPVENSNPAVSLKIKIPKDKIKTEAPRTELKIKIPKEVITGGLYSGETSGKKRERDRSSPNGGGLGAPPSKMSRSSSSSSKYNSEPKQNGRHSHGKVAQLGDGEQSQHRLAESKYIKNSS